jgi:hypothetical protein
VIRTTLANPTLWVLLALALYGVRLAVAGVRSAGWGMRNAVSGPGTSDLGPRPSNHALRTSHPPPRFALRRASPAPRIPHPGILTSLPILLLLIAMALANAGSRIVLGYLSPGAYAEEVVAAHRFTGEGGLYGTSTGVPALQTTGAAPWASLPGITACQANAMENRERFFTEHAHPPTLLLAGVPVVRVAGAKGLYVAVVLLSLAAVLAMVWVALERAGIPWRSRQALLVFAVILGWQPVIAGIRQGDAVLPAAGLVALSWHFARVGRGSAFTSALAACLTVPAIGVLPAMLRQAPRAGSAALLLVFVMGLATVTIAGASVMPDFARTMSETTRTYADAVANYSVAGRVLGAGTPVAAVALGLVFGWTWWRARTVDAAFAGFVAAGLLVAPVLWSQHLALTFVPALALLAHVLRTGSPLALSAWALLMLSLSLPDTAVIGISRGLSAMLDQHVSPVPLATVALWAWSTARA